MRYPSLTAKEQAAIYALLSGCTILPMSFEIAESAARIARKLPKRGMADLLIAATALEHKLPLYTYNKKDFTGIRGLKIIN